MCGIIGVAGRKPVVGRLYDGLSLLQHRGQEAAGIATLFNGKLCRRKSTGLVRDVFSQKHIDRLKGNMGIGHVRYSTAGAAGSAEAQPFYVNSPYGIVLAHNGNLVNANDLHRDLYESDLRHINTSSDSEILLNILAHELSERATHEYFDPIGSVFPAVGEVIRRAEGGYACVAMILGKGLIAFRDPNGIRPLIYGTRESSKGTEYMFASESVAITGNGFKVVRDVKPGEVFFVDTDGVLHNRVVILPTYQHTPCIFEWVYLARPDSIIEGISVYKTRLRMGKELADQIKSRKWAKEIDVVIPIPDTGRQIALEVSRYLKVPYREGFIKNRYIGRTFIMPGQKEREDSVRKKLSPVSVEFEGLNVLLVDDSIVRGTTSQQIVKMARDAGAKSVTFASAAPPVKYPNVYGIDMPSVKELIAHNRHEDQICRIIGADRVVYQTIEALRRAVREGGGVTTLDDSCFTGVYSTPSVDDKYLAEIERNRGNV
jgi:amidophosphoribosyltransferase